MRAAKAGTQYQRGLIMLEDLQAPHQIGRLQEHIGSLHVLEAERMQIVARVAFTEAQYHAGPVLAAQRRYEAEAPAEATQA
ncbi:hypothetical protein [Cupriavidus sp. CuC1]|uniref:hypothetical protein n=1 Tax=Cupriavidus sp. CuC1 TaxID=3373131 RepID=UPI0037D04BD5